MGEAERIPPHDLDAERAILSAVMVDPVAYPKAAPIVRPESFYAEAHRRIFEAAEALALVGKPIDVVQVATWLRDHERITQVGGMAYLTEVLNAAPAVANIEAYAHTVAIKWRVRRMILAGQRIVAEGYAGVEDGDDWIDHAEQLVHEVAMAKANRKPPDTMKASLHRVFTKMHFNERGGGGYTGTPTGIDSLDEATGGMQEGESYVIAARPAMGKTSLAMNIASGVAGMGLGVVVFSQEMPNEQLATRAMCSEAGVDVQRARTNTFTPSDWSKMTTAVQKLAKPEHYYLHEEPAGLLEMRSIVRARQLDMDRSKVKLGLIVVDYLQLMPRYQKAENNEQSVAANARGLKLLSKEVRCPVLILSQLNRGVESRQDKRPLLSDLRESGGVEEAADAVIGLYRDDYYFKESKSPGVVELIILKQRSGPVGTVYAGFRASSVTFYNLPDANGPDGERYS